MSVIGENTGVPFPAGIGVDRTNPWFWRTNQGVPAALCSGAINPLLGIGYSGIILGFLADGSCIRYKDSEWTTVTADITGNGAIVNAMAFVDSRGYVYFSTDKGGIWRTKDDADTPWEKVHTMSDPNHYSVTMCEDDVGDLYATEYQGDIPHLLKSTTNGDSFIDITANLDVQFANHMHSLHWCKHRNMLFVSGGDSAENMQFSDDYGATFNSIVGAFPQATGITTDADYIYWNADGGTDRKIYRGSGNTVAEILATTWIPVFDPESLPEVTNPLGLGFAWWGYVDDNGYIIFPYGKEGGVSLERGAIMVSPDQGDTWFDMQSDTGAGFRIGHEFGMGSAYGGLWDGFFYGEHALVGLFQWRIYPVATQFHVDLVGGADFPNSGIASEPFSEIPEWNVMDSGVEVTLDSNYTENAQLGSDGVLYNRGAFTLGAAVTGAPDTQDDFEGLIANRQFAENSVNPNASILGTTTNNSDTGNAYSGTQHATASINSTGANATAYMQINGIYSGVTSGQSAWQSGWYKASLANPGNFNMMEMTSGMQVYLVGQSLAMTYGGMIYTQDPIKAVTIPVQTYFYVKLRVIAHATQGRITVWQDGIMVIDVRGIPVPPGSFFHARWGIKHTDIQSWYIDDCKAQVGGDPDTSAAYVLNGTGQKVIPDGVYS